jgi:hypothetical protein
MVGADSSPSTVAMTESIIDFIPDSYLKQFAQYVLKHYDKYKKPLVNVTTAGQEFKKQLILTQIGKNEFQFTDPKEVCDFLLEFFRGQEIANCITGLYFDFVTISMNEKGEYINNFAQKKLDSQEVNDFIHWCFVNQKQIGKINLIDTQNIHKILINNHASHHQTTLEHKEEDSSKTNTKIATMISATYSRMTHKEGK